LKTLSSFDQFSNLVLLDTIERRIVTVDKISYYADIPLGIYIVRGDSMVLMGTIPDDNSMPNLQEVDLEKLQELDAKADPALKWDFDIDLTA
jgi:U6 snRNA-associated Sm-like protein LSm1